MPMAVESLGVILREVIRRNRVRWGIVYLQVSRGVSRRDHAFSAGRHAAEHCRHRAQSRSANAEKMAATASP